jgi:glycosyltransferase involved in cell wall biosynthesis
MNIVLTVPSMSVPHGGIRIILEWANRLSVNHGVILFCRKGITPPSWMTISRKVKLTSNIRDMHFSDLLVICSPHDIDLAKTPGTPKRKVIFLQMLEHLFKEGAPIWAGKCYQTYGADVPIILISQWNLEYIKKNYPNRKSPLYYVGNGVNFDDFPVEADCEKDGKTILIEGWESINDTKDPYAIGPMAAGLLRKAGYRILAYSQLPIARHPEIPHGYFFRPSLEKLNELYRRSSILIKTSRYDARACAPMEAMTKGCVTVRGIFQGDDDLVDGENCIRISYDNENAIVIKTKELMNDPVALLRLRKNCLDYVQKYSWDYWMPKIEDILCSV